MTEIDVNELAKLMREGNNTIQAPPENIEGVTNPEYYNFGNIEVIEAINEWGYGKGFCRGNAIKYIARAGRKSKETEIQDLQKAIQYLQIEITRLKEGK